MLANIGYFPSLKTRVSEVEAYSFLSNGAKDRSFPLFSLRPWPNANHLQLAVDRVVEAVEGRPFALGLDRERFAHSSKNPAQDEFDELFDDHLGFDNYYEFLDEIDNAVPVLQTTLDANNLLRQLGNAHDLDRGLIVHQSREQTIPISETIIDLPPLPNDTVFVVDAGWSRDFLQLQSWALTTARRIFDRMPAAEVVVMSSSFPASFSHIVGTLEEPSHEDGVYDAVRQNLQDADLTYGDWGSTRLSQSGGGGKIPPRLDIPRLASWQIFRAAPDGDENFLSLAEDVKDHEAFDLLPECWGKLQVEATDAHGAGVKSIKMNTSCRINMHMTIRSGAETTLDLDEQPYED